MLIRSRDYVQTKQQKEMIRNMDHTTVGVERRNHSKINPESVSAQPLINPKKRFLNKRSRGLRLYFLVIFNVFSCDYLE